MTNIPDHFSTLLTPAGSGAIALIRVTGRDAMRIVSRVFEPVKQTFSRNEAVNKLSYGWIVQDGEPIDDVIVSAQQQASPPFVDISMHAGIRIVERILATLSNAGAPLLEGEQSPAWPTCSLIEQEALTALQQAKSKHGAALSMRLWMDLRPHLMQLVDKIQYEPESTSKALIQLMRGYPQTCALFSGISITLVGPPNSGKSTLFNRLLGRSTAIVNDLAGTTRDWITGEVEIGGLPVSLIDTAGLHYTEDYLENIAITKGFSMTANVDGCILILDSSTAVNQQRESLNLLQNVSIPTVIALNKCDLTGSPDVCGSDANQYDSFTVPSVRCSAATGEGIDSLMQTMLLTVGVYPAKDPELSLFTQRQIEATQKILDLLKKSPSRTADSIVDDLIQPVYPV